MNKWRPWLIDISLIFVIFLLLLLLFIPWGKKNLALQPVDKNNANSGKIVIDIPETAVPLQSARERIAYLFGWAKPVTVNTNATSHKPEKTPTPIADWIKPMTGYAVDETGKYFYFFKDSTTNQILKLPLGGTSKGWKLVAVHTGDFLLEYEGKQYIVH